MDANRRQYLKAAAIGGLSYFFSPLNLNFGFDEASAFEIFRHPHAHPLELNNLSQPLSTTTLGESGGIFVDCSRRLVKKVYAQDIPCVGGAISKKYNAALYHDFFYQKEKQSYLTLMNMGSRYIPSRITFNDDERSITMSHHGVDLLINEFQKQWQPKEKHIEQIVEMAEEYRQAGFFKRNICASNLIYDRAQDRLLAIDFKFAVPRKADVVAQEVQHHYMLLRKINPTLPERMQTTFADFSAEHVAAYAKVSDQIYSTNSISEHDTDLRLKLLKQIQAAV